LNFIAPAGFEEWIRSFGSPTTGFDLPDKVEPPAEAELARMNEFAPQLGLRLVGPSPEF